MQCPASMIWSRGIRFSRSDTDAPCRQPRRMTAPLPFIAVIFTSIAPEQRDQLALDTNPVRGENAHFVCSIGGLKRNRGSPPAEAFEGRLLVIDQRHYDVPGIGPIRLLDDRDVPIENSCIDHAVAAHLQ